MKATQAEPRDRAHVGDVSDPEPVWALGSEAALDEVGTSIRLTCRPRGDRLTAAPNPFHAGELHRRVTWSRPIFQPARAIAWCIFRTP